MLVKLRKKIILINVSMVSIVLICVFTAICVNSYHAEKGNLKRELQQAIDSVQEANENKSAALSPEENGKNGHESKRKFIAPSVTVTLDSTGEIIRISENNASIDADTLSEAVAAACRSDESSEIISSLQMMYLKRVLPNGMKIAFTDTGMLTTALRRDILSSSLLCLGSIGLLFLISLWLSGVAVKPIAEAWEKQKQFIADASHELKTPLTVILANNNILMAHKSDTIAAQQQWLESTDAEANHMKKLIDQMLILAKSDAGHIHLSAVSVDLSGLIEEHILYFEPVAYEKGVAVSGQIEPNIRICSDPVVIRQLIQILLDNAIKYSSADSVVRVSLKRISNSAVLSVNNSGNTIAPEDLPHIFDRFYRTDKARSAGGHGLGLAIAKALAGDLHADLTAASSPEDGTTFKLTFTLSRQTAGQ